MQITASYKQHPIGFLNGNPLTEAIQPIQSHDVLTEKLTQKPRFDQSLWDLSEAHQQVLLQQLYKTHIPVPQLVSLYNKCIGLILDGYAKFSPFSADTQRLQMKVATAALEGEEVDFEKVSRTTAPTVLIDGHSGIGKTLGIRSVLKVIPQVIEHHSYGDKLFKQKQLVWVSFDLPSTNSAKALALNFFQAVDEALGTDYYEEWKNKTNTSVERYFGQMRVIAVNHHLGLVHIDEMQFLLSYNANAKQETPSFSKIESLFNKFGIPILLSMTTAGKEILLARNDKDDFTLARRLLSDTSFTFKLHKANSQFFETLFNVLFQPELCTEQHRPSQLFKLKFHDLSAGLPSMMIRLAFLHHEAIAIKRARKPEKADMFQTDDYKALIKVYNRQFNGLKDALESLKAGNHKDFEKNNAKADSEAEVTFSNEETKEPRYA